MTTRRSFLRGAGAVVAGAAISRVPSEAPPEATATPLATTASPVAGERTYTCPRCGERNVKPVPVKLEVDAGVGVRRLASERGRWVPLITYVEGCEKCASIGVRVL